MPIRSHSVQRSIAGLAETLLQLRVRSHMTQGEIGARMATTQTAVARLERGRHSPTLQTLQNYVNANGFALEIGFIRHKDVSLNTGCVIFIDDKVLPESNDP